MQASDPSPGATRADALLARAARVLPGGTSHNIRTYPPRPVLAERAEGGHLVDVDGRRFLDFWQSHNASLLGHAHPAVTAAVQAFLAKGVHFGTVHEGEVELAERIRRHVPSVEKMRFTTSGSESTMYAVRVARAYTGRTLVAKAAGAWHGGNEALLHSVAGAGPGSEGLLPMSSREVLPYRYNDVEGTKALLRAQRGRLAAVIVEPILGDGGGIRGAREFLGMLRDECTDGGALLVFDEIITGFRMRLGGVQTPLGIRPDLTTLGKIIGGEMPIGCYGGREDVMDIVAPTPEAPPRCWTGGGTFSAHALAMAAGNATLRHLEGDPGLYERLEATTRRAVEGVDRTFRDAGIPTRTIQAGSLFNTLFPRPGEGEAPLDCVEEVRARTDLALRARYRTLLLEEGVFILPTHGCGAFSAAHTGDDVRWLVEASQRVAKRMAPEIAAGA